MKAKLSLTGAETGAYYSAEELSNLIDRVWPAVCTVQAATGARAGDVCIGQAVVSISPVVPPTEEPFSRVTVRQEGETPAKPGVRGRLATPLLRGGALRPLSQPPLPRTLATHSRNPSQPLAPPRDPLATRGPHP